MKEDWHVRPRLFKQVFKNFEPLCDIDTIFEMASDENIESRLIEQRESGWNLEHGPFEELPSLDEKKWTVLVQGIDHHLPEAYDLLQLFRFIPDARLDDVMLSLASDQGGVGPHYDSYDVFLLQMHGKRRWKIGPLKNAELLENCPLKILKDFTPTEEFLLEPGDMLYLPPKWAHDGVAEGECMTWSIGFRSPQAGELARELLQGLADEAAELVGEAVYRDPQQPAVAQPALIPADLQTFAQEALAQAQRDPRWLAMLLGEYLSAPKDNVWFDSREAQPWTPGQGVALHRRSRMLYDAQHIFLNGEGFAAAGRDARLLRRLADARVLSAKDCAALSAQAQEALAEWAEAGWLQAQ